MITKKTKHCPSCQTKYVVAWDFEKNEMEPITCPFCSHEIDEEGVADVLLDDNAINKAPRPGTSFSRPLTSAG